MSQKRKSEVFQALKAEGVEFSKHYRDYSTKELEDAWDQLQARKAELGIADDGPEEPPAQAHLQPPDLENELQGDPEAMAFFGQQPPETPRMPARSTTQAPLGAQDPDELPGQRLNTNIELEPIRTDELGRVWFQEEVRKPSGAQPRGRRVLSYIDRGTETRQIRDGEFVETFEVGGQGAPRSMQVKITLPSYQVGIYKDPRFPFKVHVYNDKQGFDLFEVQNYYGGAEFVPESVKKTYVENVLCYDIRTVVRAIQMEYRQLQLQGKVK